MSNVNSGIIASIFSTSVAFTCIMFYFIYNQKLNKSDIIGIFLIIICVVLIGIGQDSSDPGQEVEAANLTLAVVFAVVTGLSFSVNSLDIYNVTQKVGFPINQMAYDGNVVLALIFLPLFVLHQ